LAKNNSRDIEQGVKRVAGILFVSATPGAIGYVSACVPEHGVDVVLIVGELPTCPK
jgi:hypothetical protein